MKPKGIIQQVGEMKGEEMFKRVIRTAKRKGYNEYEQLIFAQGYSLGRKEGKEWAVSAMPYHPTMSRDEIREWLCLPRIK